MGSTYSVKHNKEAAKFIIQDVAPRALAEFGENVCFHITGAKLPKTLQKIMPKNVVYDGYVTDYAKFLLNSEVALAPSLGGAGMQQKVFEPIARGVPTITSPRGLAGYAFKNGTHVFTTVTVSEILEVLRGLFSREERATIGTHGKERALQLFSRQHVTKVVEQALLGILG